MKKVLISGVPGTGKTHLGNYFEEQGFFHLNMEEKNFTPARNFELDPEAFMKTLPDDKDIVITWGFGPFMEKPLVQQLIDAGYKMFWLDGDRTITFKSFMNREKHDSKKEYLYYSQMAMIIVTDIINQLKPTVIEPFTEAGAFRPVQSVYEEIIASPSL